MTIFEIVIASKKVLQYVEMKKLVVYLPFQNLNWAGFHRTTDSETFSGD